MIQKIIVYWPLFVSYKYLGYNLVSLGEEQGVQTPPLDVYLL